MIKKIMSIGLCMGVDDTILLFYFLNWLYDIITYCYLLMMWSNKIMVKFNILFFLLLND